MEHLKPKVNIFDGEKEKLYFGYLADVRFLKSVFKEILNNLYVLRQQLMWNIMVLTEIILLKLQTNVSLVSEDRWFAVQPSNRI